MAQSDNLCSFRVHLKRRRIQQSAPPVKRRSDSHDLPFQKQLCPPVIAKEGRFNGDLLLRNSAIVNSKNLLFPIRNDTWVETLFLNQQCVSPYKETIQSNFIDPVVAPVHSIPDMIPAYFFPVLDLPFQQSSLDSLCLNSPMSMLKGPFCNAQFSGWVESSYLSNPVDTPPFLIIYSHLFPYSSSFFTQSSTTKPCLHT